MSVDSTYNMSSITSNARNLSENHEIGCALPVGHLVEDVGGVTTDNEVILLYMPDYVS